MKPIPLVRVLTDAGYGSRREASKLIDAGMVEVNGRIASSFTEKIDPETDSVVVVGRKVANAVARRVYIVMNKPAGYLSTTEDERGRPTVMDLLPPELRCEGLHPAGRLDEDSTGLLILTNDGQFTYELTHPRYEHEKEYYVATTGRLTEADMRELARGVEVEGQVTWPARVVALEGQSPYSYSIAIHEGRKRQVREMFSAIGQQVALLKRVRIGGLLLAGLPEGAARELTAVEVKALLGAPPVRAASTAARREKRPAVAHAGRPARAPRTFTGPKLMKPRATGEGGGVEPRLRPVSYETAVPPRQARTPGPERPGREAADARAERSYGRRPDAGRAERPYARPAREAGFRSSERRVAGPQRPGREAADARAERPYGRRPDAGRAERPYAGSAREAGFRSSDRRVAGPQRPGREVSDVRAERPYRRRPDAGRAERPYAGSAREARPRSFDQPGPGFRRPQHGAVGERGGRPYSGPAPTYRRPARDEREVDRRREGPFERSYGGVVRDGVARPLHARGGRPPSARPYGSGLVGEDRVSGRDLNIRGGGSSRERPQARGGAGRRPGASPSGGRRRPPAPR